MEGNKVVDEAVKNIKMKVQVLIVKKDEKFTAKSDFKDSKFLQVDPIYE